MSQVGRNIKKFRENKNLTQEEMAEQLNVTRQTVSSWETGRTEPDIETLERIAAALDVTVEELIYSRRLNTPVVTINKGTTVETVEKGVSFGAVLAMVISYAHWHSIGWAVIHGLLGWVYVIYYLFRYAEMGLFP